jgi:flagellum-specific peptidoglycan hydrolase FlgJ
MTGDLQARLDQVAAIAVSLQDETGLPAEETIAQWAIESQWGAKPAGQHNYFGIKRAGRHTKFCTVETREVVAGRSIMCHLEFADYDSLEDSCRDFAWLITHGAPYAKAWASFKGPGGGLQTLISSVALVYATDPNYARLAVTIAMQSNVECAIAKARGK